MFTLGFPRDKQFYFEKKTDYHTLDIINPLISENGMKVNKYAIIN